jgi:hypothetical protein
MFATSGNSRQICEKPAWLKVPDKEYRDDRPAKQEG